MKQIKYLVKNFNKIKQETLHNKTKVVLNSLYGYSKHFEQRIASKQIMLPSYLLSSIATGKFELIELNHTYYSKHCYNSRVVVRSVESYDNKQLCLVVNLDGHTLVTAWNNDINDNHSTINLENFVN